MNHGGEILVESERDKGTTVTVYLPQTEATVRETEEVGVVGGDEHVLFVDDEPEIVKLGRRMLERLGYQVTTARGGDDTLRLLRESPNSFDVLISDQTMPNTTGLAIAERVRQIRKDLPVILMTGYSDTITAERLEELQISGMIMKPLAGKKLGGAIRKALDNKPKSGEE
jgi:DNA-binding NtrC family response regulator